MSSMPSPSYSLVIGTPCFGGQVSWLYAVSLLKLQQAFAQRGWRLGFLLQAGDALVTRARQTIVCHFLEDNPGATHLLFIDADIEFEPEQVFRLLEFGADFTAAVYPVKQINWELMAGAAQAGRSPLESATLAYVVERDTADKLFIRNGFVKSRYAGTGFLMVRRSVLEAMIEHYPELRYTHEHTGNDPLDGSRWRSALFNCMVDQATGFYLSEDFSFCRRWTDMGGEIWVDHLSRLNHVGVMVYRGNLAARVNMPPE